MSLRDNQFWYIGYTHSQLGDKHCDKAFCLILRNPFDRSWKKWAAIEARGAYPNRQRKET